MQGIDTEKLDKWVERQLHNINQEYTMFGDLTTHQKYVRRLHLEGRQTTLVRLQDALKKGRLEQTT